MKSAKFNTAIAAALAVIIMAATAALLFVVTRSSVTDARSIYKGGGEKYAVLRRCVQEPRVPPCDRSDVALNVGRASWQAFATVDFLADVLTSIVVLLGSSAFGCAYLAFAFFRKP